MASECIDSSILNRSPSGPRLNESIQPTRSKLSLPLGASITPSIEMYSVTTMRPMLLPPPFGCPSAPVVGSRLHGPAAAVQDAFDPRRCTACIATARRGSLREPEPARCRCTRCIADATTCLGHRGLLAASSSHRDLVHGERTGHAHARREGEQPMRPKTGRGHSRVTLNAPLPHDNPGLLHAAVAI